MRQNEIEYEELIRAFHLTWDRFPGPARLIDKENHVLAVNPGGGSGGADLRENRCSRKL